VVFTLPVTQWGRMMIDWGPANSHTSAIAFAKAFCFFLYGCDCNMLASPQVCMAGQHAASRCPATFNAFALCLDLLFSAHLAWLTAWLSCLPCRSWCITIIIIISSCRACLWVRGNSCPQDPHAELRQAWRSLNCHQAAGYRWLQHWHMSPAD
jgi:hypothetical protein